MKIKTKIEIIIISSIIAVSVISGLLYLATQRTKIESVEAAKADKLVKEISEFNVLVSEYMLHHEERSPSQARLKFESINRLLKEEEFEYPEERAILAKIRQNYESVGSAFSVLIATYESPKFSKKEIDMSLELVQRLQGTIMSKSQEMISYALYLAKMIRTEEKKHHDRLHLLIFMSLVIMFAGVILNSVVLITGIIKPITMLYEGTKIIGSGNLDYKIGIETKDEIGQLSRAFDTMTENLKLITVSRDELTREIAERKLIEEKLRQVNKELEQHINEIKTLRGILPICSYCKKIRNDKGYWEQLEKYITEHSEALLSHGMCPQCAEKVYKEWEEFKK